MLHLIKRKTLLAFALVLCSLFFLISCQQKEKQKLPEPTSGVIPNGSAELVESSQIMGWKAYQDDPSATHFYSNIAKEGKKSFYIQSVQPSNGVWKCDVSVKPWSKYKFSGWIKTEGLQNPEGKGAGFKPDNFPVEYIGFTGNNDWAEVNFEFETGSNDSFVLQCLFNNGGKTTGKVWFDDMKLELLSSEVIKTNIVVDAKTEMEPMSDYIYGQFIEHLGKCINGGIWAEMIEDRKFYYEPNNELSPWIIEGDTSILSMDKKDSYTGDQTPVFNTLTNSKVILRQNGLGFRKEMAYDGRIVLKTSGSITSVKIRLLDNNTKEQIGETVINKFQNGYAKYPISFRSPVFTQNGSIEIIPEGIGKVWLGAISLMPQDNVEGFRADVLALLKGLNSPIYRWPGGNFVSGYNWRDGIGDRDKRPPRKNPAWDGVEYNDMGMNEFMRLCELLNTKPYIAVNAGLGNFKEAANQVEYCNGDIHTPMGKWRAENGHSEPWKVEWWGVGNEMYGDWQLGHMSTEAFVEKNNQFADAMYSIDPKIKIVAVGNVGAWDEMILAKDGGKMDYLSEHFYSSGRKGLMTHIEQIPRAIKKIADAHREYRKNIPGLKEKNIKICMDEWNYWYGPYIYGELGTRYFLRDALGIAAGINEFSKNSDVIYMANYAQTVNVLGAIKTNTTHSAYEATGMALKMYRDHFGSIPVKISGETRPFDVAATLTADRKTLVVSIVNPTWESQSFKLDINNLKLGTDVELYTLIGPDDMSFNTPGEKESVIIDGPVKQKLSDSYEVKPYSANLFRFAIK